ncbi:hypothetical protein SAMN05660473_00312 [Arthrobacter sp. 49Tsu3.1M3]|nr:hypothetical protein SAMN05660473_00312 [Arthrobacter sp. 49Tsu3.1M3]
MERAASILPEMTEVKPLLEQSSRGIEFLGRSARAAAVSLEAMGSSTGVQRHQHLFDVLAILSRAPESERRYLADEYEVGFTNLSNFNRHFRNDAGETPRDNRQRAQN